MEISKYLDSTHLKTSQESFISEDQNINIVRSVIQDSINYQFKSVMIRSEYIGIAKDLISNQESDVLIGTVVDFPFGRSRVEDKLIEMLDSINAGADELDCVCNYNLFKQGRFQEFDNEIQSMTEMSRSHKKVIKWIIETGALSDLEIKNITTRISTIVMNDFSKFSSNVFVKTCTGYYGGGGANIKNIKIMKSVIGNLLIKASGGISNLVQLKSLLAAGADRIGTSKAVEIIRNQ